MNQLQFIWKIRIFYSPIQQFNYENKNVVIAKIVKEYQKNLIQEGKDNYVIEKFKPCFWDSPCSNITKSMCLDVQDDLGYFCDCIEGYQKVNQTCQKLDYEVQSNLVEKFESLDNFQVAPVSCKNLDPEQHPILILIENTTDSSLLPNLIKFLKNLLAKFSESTEIFMFAYDISLSRILQDQGQTVAEILKILESPDAVMRDLDLKRITGIRRLDYSLSESILDLNFYKQVLDFKLYHTFIFTSGVFGDLQKEKRSSFSSSNSMTENDPLRYQNYAEFITQASILSSLSQKVNLFHLSQNTKIESKFDKFADILKIILGNEKFKFYDLGYNLMDYEMVDLILSEICDVLPCDLGPVNVEKGRPENPKPTEIVFLIDVSKKVKIYYKAILEAILKLTSQMVISPNYTQISIMVYREKSKKYARKKLRLIY